MDKIVNQPRVRKLHWNLKLSEDLSTIHIILNNVQRLLTFHQENQRSESDFSSTSVDVTFIVIKLSTIKQPCNTHERLHS